MVLENNLFIYIFFLNYKSLEDDDPLPRAVANLGPKGRGMVDRIYEGDL